VATWAQDMFCNFYLVNYHEIAKKNSATPKAREKITTDLESLEFQKFFGVYLTKFKTIKFNLIKLATDFF
jgi:hypothetical protein